MSEYPKKLVSRDGCIATVSDAADEKTLRGLGCKEPGEKPEKEKPKPAKPKR